MGEMNFEQKALTKAVDSALQEAAQTVTEMCVATPGGRFHVRWDEGGSATALGQLAFFAEFLEVSGLFARWKEGCPTAYTSPNAPTVVNVLGTWLLSILDGQRRYAHVTGLRGDAVAPEILGMSKIISDESLRRALAHLAPEQAKRCSDEDRAGPRAQLAKSTAWMDAALAESTGEALHTPWVLDADTSVKLLYGHQAGAEIGYNPTKPGRPSHTLAYLLDRQRSLCARRRSARREEHGRQTQPAPSAPAARSAPSRETSRPGTRRQRLLATRV
jgi:hypothetical protein